MKKNFALISFVLICVISTMMVGAAQFGAAAAPPRSPIEICNDTIDNDGDGDIDEQQCQTSPVSTPISGDGVVPELWNDNPNCEDLGYGFGFKVNNPTTGTYTFTSADGELTGGAPEDPSNSVTFTISGNLVNWSSTLSLDGVFVKGGPEGGNFYNYNPEDTSDTGLSTPGSASGISHIEICYDYEAATNTPTDTPTNTPTDTPTNTPTDTPTNTPTDTPTNTPTDTPTNTPTDTPTNTPTDTPTNTPTDTPTNTPTNTPTLKPTSVPQGHLKVCKVAGAGVPAGTVFTINVNGNSYQVPAGKDAGLCVLIGAFPLDTVVTIQEVNIPAGFFVSRIEVKPGTRTVSKNVSQATVLVKIGTGVTEVIFTNRGEGIPTPTPNATRTPGAPTPTPAITGRLQICKADIPGVSANFTFTFAGKTRTIPDGTCTSLIVVPVGPLTITEQAQAGYVLTKVHTIPADRLISTNLAARQATVTIVQGNASTQTIAVFTNQVDNIR